MDKIDSIHIQNFKLHQDTKIDLGNLTILCGANGSGKSTVIQTYLLMRQSHEKGRLNEVLDLNKPYCYIGSAKDAISQFGDENEIIFEFGHTGRIDKYSFTSSKDLESGFLNRLFDKDLANIKIAERKVDPKLPIIDDPLLQYLMSEPKLFERSFHYLSCLRSYFYEKDDFAVEKENKISLDRGMGELLAQFLYSKKDSFVWPGLRHESNKFTDLLSQTSSWEREISSGVNVIPIKSGPSYDIKYSFEGKGDNGSTNEFIKENVGYGLSYALPVIVAILSSLPGSLLIIENPDDHLHPAAAHKMAELICKAAHAGIQIIIETHNDHIINGTLVNVKKGIINPDEIKIWYFDRDEETQAAKATEIPIYEGGRISYPPNGFFDQMRKDRKELLGF